MVPGELSAGSGGARNPTEVLRLTRAGGCAATTLVLTDNRRVMASVASRGATLRLNAAFLSAPDEVLYAVGVLFSPARKPRRLLAAATVRAFIRDIPAAVVIACPRPRRIPAADGEPIRRLRAEFERVNAESFAGALPPVPIFLSGRMRRRNGHFSADPLEIVLSRRLWALGEAGEVEETLRHEMIHLWQHVSKFPVDHGASFRRMARLLGVHPRARRDVRWRAGATG